MSPDTGTHMGPAGLHGAQQRPQPVAHIQYPLLAKGHRRSLSITVPGKGVEREGRPGRGGFAWIQIPALRAGRRNSRLCVGKHTQLLKVGPGRQQLAFPGPPKGEHWAEIVTKSQVAETGNYL